MKGAKSASSGAISGIGLRSSPSKVSPSWGGGLPGYVKLSPARDRIDSLVM